jgi:hypothetical protein
MENSVKDVASHRPNSFLADLAQAMRSAAETGKQASIDRCRSDAEAYVEHLQARTSDDAGAMRSASESDVSTIRERSKAEVERVRVETEQRIARRMELLEQQLAETDAALQREVELVQERVAAFQDEVAQFFAKLPEGGDPTAFANMASRMPNPPDFDPQPEAPAEEPQSAPTAQAPAGRAPLLPGTLSGAGAVRGRLIAEWYPEVERLKEVGDEDGAVDLLLDMVTGTEAESVADGSYVATRPYAELAAIYEGHADAEAEYSILERFSRQQYAPGAAASKLLERKAAFKKTTKR